jgi:uncharacterized membrane protein
MARAAIRTKLARMSDETRERAKRVTRGFVALAMTTMGVLHFARADAFVQIMPPIFPAPLALVWISGVFEILGGVGVLVPRTRALAGWGLVLLYVAVFPANIYMALEPVAIDGAVPDRWLVWARLPLQPVFMWVAWWCTRPRR